MDEVVLTEHSGTGIVDELEPLWGALRDHHAQLGEPLRMQPPHVSWQLRRREYLQWLSDSASFVIVARRGPVAVGYALVICHEGPDDTWVTGDVIAEVETLSVLPSERGQGIGTLLLDAVDRELANRGIRDLQIGVIAANADALRFYERRGLRRRIVLLSRYDTAHDPIAQLSPA